MEQRGEVTHSGPSRVAEGIVAFFVPPACRQEVLGDLYERFQSPSQYARAAMLTVPMVIFSRVRRTADPQILLIQAFVLYMSFLGAAWFRGRALLTQPWGLLRLAIPAALAMLALIFDDAYAVPGHRSSVSLGRGPLLGTLAAMASQGILSAGDSGLELPRWVAFYGCGMSLLLASAVRMLFPPVTHQILGTSAPALWLKRAGESNGSPETVLWILKGISALVAVAAIGTWLGERSLPPRAAVGIVIVAALAVAYQVLKR